MDRAVRISEIVWDDYRIDHIAEHGVVPEEVWEVCEDPRHLARHQGRDRYRLYGQTEEGRYVFVVLQYMSGTVFKTITARDMTAGEKRNFRRLRR
jgi:uncharacterized DUF497 family protein